MSLFPAASMNWDGKEPYATDGTAENPTAAYPTWHTHKFKQGSTGSVVITVSNTNNPGLDLSDYTFRAEFKSTLAGDAVITLLSSASAGDDSIEISGLTLTLTIKKATTAALSVITNGVWDLEATATSGGQVDRWISGTWGVTAEVTTGG